MYVARVRAYRGVRACAGVEKLSAGRVITRDCG